MHDVDNLFVSCSLIPLVSIFVFRFLPCESKNANLRICVTAYRSIGLMKIRS